MPSYLIELVNDQDEGSGDGLREGSGDPGPGSGNNYRNYHFED